jgi:hypothetical protein
LTNKHRQIQVWAQIKIPGYYLCHFLDKMIILTDIWCQMVEKIARTAEIDTVWCTYKTPLGHPKYEVGEDKRSEQWGNHFICLTECVRHVWCVCDTFQVMWPSKYGQFYCSANLSVTVLQQLTSATTFGREKSLDK